LPIRIETVAETGSTNGDLLARVAAGERIPEGYWLVADRQSAGRGRQGRRWLDAPGNLMGSTAVSLSSHDPPPATLSFVAALAVYEIVLPRVRQPRDLQLKWPNDVMLRGDKFCGLLLERERDQAVVGVGVNLAAAPEVIDRIARSLSEEGPAPARDAFAADLARQFDEELGRWRQFGTGPILARWSAAAHPEGSPLAVHDPAGEGITGTYSGLEADGALRLRLVDGTLRVIHAGDVSLGN
jgi:BirA family biotin operon repressor/biotin-[acetyl-CoA-carboxylase] ligase